MSDRDEELAATWSLEAFVASFELALERGETPRIEEWLGRAPKQTRQACLTELVSREIHWRLVNGMPVSEAEYLARFPENQGSVVRALEKQFSSHFGEAGDEWLADTHDHKRQHEAETSRDKERQSPRSGQAVDSPRPKVVGRYEVIRRIGQGSFGVVYEGWDPQLERRVAIKMVRQCCDDSSQVKAFLAEARSVASLDHPHIVPVFDVGEAPGGGFFIISKLVDGCDLGKIMRQGEVSRDEAVKIISSIALALHHAHQRGFVHRDVKPANILVDGQGNAYLTDFGIALPDSALGQGGGFVGTPWYMSPEQISGNSHRLDGRSDIFGLGVVFYELLTGRKPFRSRNPLELRRQICMMEAKPLRQIDDTIPESLERICLKALAKNVNDRYATASDFAHDLLNLRGEPQRGRWTTSLWLAIAGTIAAVCAIALVAGLMLGRSSGLQPTKDSLADSKASNRVPPESASQDVSLIEEFIILVSRGGQDGFSPVSEIAPLRNGDVIRFSVRLSEPAYPRLLWVDSRGNIDELYPNDPEVGDRGGHMVQRFESPVELDRGWPVEGADGTEAAVLLVSRDGLPRLPGEFRRLGIIESTSTGSVVRLRAVGSGVERDMELSDRTRSLAPNTRQVDDGLRKVVERLRFYAEDVVLVAIPHRASQSQP